jgi:hypothetical protein
VSEAADAPGTSGPDPTDLDPTDLDPTDPDPTDLDATDPDATPDLTNPEPTSREPTSRKPTSPDPPGEQKTAAQRALDLLVFAPAGLVLSAMDDLPSFAAKGRARLEQHVRNAHVVGRFVVDKGQQDLQRRIDRATRSGRDPDQEPPTSGPSPDAATGVPPRAARGPSTGTATSRPAGGASDHDVVEPVTGAPEPPEPAGEAGDGGADKPTVAGATGGPPAAPTHGFQPGFGVVRAGPPVDAAIPGYDTLSASQVVRRLDGLGRTELESVLRHEGATRGRRTILHRTQQLLGMEEPPGASGPPA